MGSDRTRPAPGIAWCIEDGGLQVLDAGRGRRIFLQYPEAALWDFISRGVPDDRIAVMMCGIADLDVESAAAFASTVREAWIRHGWMSEGRIDG